jgi:hypothetical protein
VDLGVANVVGAPQIAQGDHLWPPAKPLIRK